MITQHGEKAMDKTDLDKQEKTQRFPEFYSPHLAEALKNLIEILEKELGK